MCVTAAKGPSKDAGSACEQQFVRSVIELHDKYLSYVTTCFSNRCGTGCNRLLLLVRGVSERDAGIL